MKFLLPTAKEMAPNQALAAQQLPAISQPIVDELSQLTLDQLAKLYKITPQAAQKEESRWQALAAGTAATYPAIQLFNGLMYRQIDRHTLSQADRDFLSTVYITSSLYGIIPALEPIAEHRLDFQQAIKPCGVSLKAYWRPHYDQFLLTADEPVISLLSSEFEEVFSSQLRHQLTQVVFHEEKDGQLKTHSTISKKGRGLFLNQAMTEKITSIDQLKNLTFAGFAYRDDLSQPNRLVFVKPS